MDMEKVIFDGIHNMGYKHEYGEGEYRVSELPYCMRKSLYRRKFGTKTELKGIMFQGTLFHEAVENIIKAGLAYKDGLSKALPIKIPSLEFEVSCSKPFKGEDNKFILIKGHADAISDDTVYEFKFTGSDPDKYGGDVPVAYAAQANLYAFILGKKFCSTVLVNRNNLKVWEFKLETDQVAAEYLCSKGIIIDRSLKSGNIPDGPEHSWECKGRWGKCDFYDICNTSKEK